MMAFDIGEAGRVVLARAARGAQSSIPTPPKRGHTSPNGARQIGTPWCSRGQASNWAILASQPRRTSGFRAGRCLQAPPVSTVVAWTTGCRTPTGDGASDSVGVIPIVGKRGMAGPLDDLPTSPTGSAAPMPTPTCRPEAPFSLHVSPLYCSRDRCHPPVGDIGRGANTGRRSSRGGRASIRTAWVILLLEREGSEVADFPIAVMGTPSTAPGGRANSRFGPCRWCPHVGTGDGRSNS